MKILDLNDYNVVIRSKVEDREFFKNSGTWRKLKEPHQSDMLGKGWTKIILTALVTTQV